MINIFTPVIYVFFFSVLDTTTVVEADKQLNQYIAEHNVSAAADMYLDDFVLTTSSGKRKNKQDMLREIGLNDLTFEVNETTQVNVLLHGNTAVLTGTLHQKGIYQNKPFDNQMLVTDTWVLMDSRWKLLAGHATLIKLP